METTGNNFQSWPKKRSAPVRGKPNKNMIKMQTFSADLISIIGLFSWMDEQEGEGEGEKE